MFGFSNFNIPFPDYHTIANKRTQHFCEDISRSFSTPTINSISPYNNQRGNNRRKFLLYAKLAYLYNANVCTELPAEKRFRLV